MGKYQKAYENNDFPAIKNTLCDWCYYKPICPVFNDNPPDTEELRMINESISDLEEEIEVLDMFKDENEVPKKVQLEAKTKNKLKLRYQN